MTNPTNVSDYGRKDSDCGNKGQQLQDVMATAVRFDDHLMWVDLDDGRTLGVPLAWFPRLLHASAQQREQAGLSPSGLHWEALDEDISIAGLLAGHGDMTRGRVA